MSGGLNLAFTDWVVRNFADIRTLFLVAGKADLGLRLLVAYLIVRRMDLVARGTRYVTDLVGAALPVSTLRILIVAGETSAVSRFRRGWGLWPSIRRQSRGLNGPEIDVHRVYGTLKVGIAPSMAVLTTRRARIGFIAHLGLIDRQHRRGPGFVVAGGAHGIFRPRRFCRCAGFGRGYSGRPCATSKYERTQSH